MKFRWLFFVFLVLSWSQNHVDSAPVEVKLEPRVQRITKIPPRQCPPPQFLDTAGRCRMPF